MTRRFHILFYFKCLQDFSLSVASVSQSWKWFITISIVSNNNIIIKMNEYECFIVYELY